MLSVVCLETGLLFVSFLSPLPLLVVSPTPSLTILGPGLYFFQRPTRPKSVPGLAWPRSILGLLLPWHTLAVVPM
jgi:hypothetical protein